MSDDKQRAAVQNQNIDYEKKAASSVVPPRMVRATVQRGRTVRVQDMTRQPEVRMYTAEGKPVMQQPHIDVGPGGEVELSEKEVAFLRQQDYLVDPDRVLPPSAGENPNVKQ